MHKRLKRSAFTTSSDNLYFDISISSNNQTRVTRTSYSAVRTRNIVDKASDYFISVIRFTIPAFYVPVLVVPIADIATGETDYSVSVGYDGEYVEKKLFYTNQGNFIPDARVSNYMFSYSQMVDMINTALEEAFNDLTAPPAGSVAPFITFNSTTQLFTLYGQNDSYNESLDPRVEVFMNDQLYSLFGSFYVERLSSGTSFNANGRDVRIKFVDLKNNVVDGIDPLDPNVYVAMMQDFSTLYNWNPYKRIVIVSNNLPIQSESVLGDGDGFLNVLTDFEPSNDVTDTRSVYQYEPSAQYRLIDMVSDAPLRNIDLAIYWQDIDSNLIPLYIPFDSQVTLKLAFIRKSMFDNNWADRLP